MSDFTALSGYASREKNMSSRNELIARGNALAEKHDIETLKTALKNAIAIDDNEERLSIQWALKQKTSTKDGYSFTKEQTVKLNERLEA